MSPMSKEKIQKSRRECIIRAALAAYGEKGIFSTRIEEVAIAAGIGKGTIYEYFRSKEELMFAAIRFDMEELAGQIKQSVDREVSVRGKLKVMVEAVMLHNRQNRYPRLDMSFTNMGSSMKDLQNLILEQNARWRGWLEEIIELGVASGEIRPVDSRLFLGALLGTVIHLVQPWDDSEWKTIPPGDAAERVTEFFFKGIGK